MENITLQKTKEVAEKANLILTTEELERFHKDLQSIFEYAHKLEEVNTDGVEPAAITNGLNNIFRADVITPSLSLEKVLSQSRHVENETFQVGVVLE